MGGPVRPTNQFGAFLNDGAFPSSSSPIRQVDLMTMALIDSAFDKEESVRKSISNALFELGRKQCELVLRYVN